MESGVDAKKRAVPYRLTKLKMSDREEEGGTKAKADIEIAWIAGHLPPSVQLPPN